MDDCGSRVKRGCKPLVEVDINHKPESSIFIQYFEGLKNIMALLGIRSIKLNHSFIHYN